MKKTIIVMPVASEEDTMEKILDEILSLPSEIPQFLQRMEEGYDCAWGSRFIEGGSMRQQPLYRRILSQGGTFLANLVLGIGLKDMTSGFEGFQRKVLENMTLDAFLSTGHMYQKEMRFYCRSIK